MLNLLETRKQNFGMNTSTSAAVSGLSSSSSNSNAASHYRSRRVSTDQTESLTHRMSNHLPPNAKIDKDELVLLKIDWHAPTSFCDAIEGRAKKANKANPPPNVYALSDDYKQNLSNLRSWYRDSNSANDSKIREYNALSLEKIALIHDNIACMVEEQVRVYNKYSEPDSTKLSISFQSLDVSTAIRNNSPSSVTGTATGTATVVALNHGRRSITPVPSQTTALQPRPMEAEANLYENGLLINGRRYCDTEIDQVMNGSRENAQTSALGYQGGFSSHDGSDALLQASAGKKRKIGFHCAIAPIKKKFFALLKKCAELMNGCVSKDHGTGDLNDVIVIHVQNVKWTKAHQIGDSKVYKFDDDMTRVTVFGRSQMLIKKIVNLTCRGIKRGRWCCIKISACS